MRRAPISLVAPSWISGALATDAPILLETDLSIQVIVTDAAGTNVPGKLVILPRFKVAFEPSQPLAPRAVYRVHAEEWVAPKRQVDFTFTTGDGPRKALTLPQKALPTLSLTWHPASDPYEGSIVLCDGATIDNGKCLKPGETAPGHRFTSQGYAAVRFDVALSMGDIDRSEKRFVSYTIVDDYTSADTEVEVRDSGATLYYKTESAKYCVRIEVRDALGVLATVKSDPICLDHGKLGALADKEPNFTSELRQCKSAPQGWADGWAAAQKGNPVSGPDPMEPGCCSASSGSPKTTEIALGALVVFGVALSRRRRS